MSTTIDSLELEITSNSKSAVEGIDALTQSLTKLRNATKGSSGLSPLANDLKKVNASLKSVKDTSSKTTGAFTDLYNQFKSVANVISSVSKKIGAAVKESMDYTENLNLFTVAMGGYASEAQE